ncbi:hypothetical protein C7212DRAFT_343894 [Tuber magnatum]|uniref:Uncharacterized protein n=1 Tax=Tuber magnatum TaxID=42249 RepID=A0A317STY7_9PEZI|nr:hypothetical protein C7212DRAFT_343894 [Tuber magnatum]
MRLPNPGRQGRHDRSHVLGSFGAGGRGAPPSRGGRGDTGRFGRARQESSRCGFGGPWNRDRDPSHHSGRGGFGSDLPAARGELSEFPGPSPDPKLPARSFSNGGEPVFDAENRVSVPTDPPAPRGTYGFQERMIDARQSNSLEHRYQEFPPLRSNYGHRSPPGDHWYQPSHDQFSYNWGPAPLGSNYYHPSFRADPRNMAEYARHDQHENYRQFPDGHHVRRLVHEPEYPTGPYASRDFREYDNMTRGAPQRRFYLPGPPPPHWEYYPTIPNHPPLWHTHYPSPGNPVDAFGRNSHTNGGFGGREDMVRGTPRARFHSGGPPPPNGERQHTTSGLPRPHYTTPRESRYFRSRSPSNPRDSHGHSTHQEEQNPRDPSRSEPFAQGYVLRGSAGGGATSHARNMRARGHLPVTRAWRSPGEGRETLRTRQNWEAEHRPQ